MKLCVFREGSLGMSAAANIYLLGRRSQKGLRGKGP